MTMQPGRSSFAEFLSASQKKANVYDTMHMFDGMMQEGGKLGAGAKS